MQVSLNFPRGENEICVEIQARDHEDLRRSIMDSFINLRPCPDGQGSPCASCYGVAVIEMLGL